MRHLLTHTAGVPEWLRPSRMINSGWFGETFPLDERLPTLAESYRGHLRLAAEPGTVWTYSDHGFAILGGSGNASGWLTGETQRMLRELIEAPGEGIRTDVPQHPEVWGRLCGWYRPRAQQTDMMAWSIFGAGAKVTVRRGQLLLRTLSPIPPLYRGLQLHPDDQQNPYVFRIDLFKYGLGTVRVVFSCDPSGSVTGLHLDGLVLSAEKHSRSIGGSREASAAPLQWCR